MAGQGLRAAKTEGQDGGRAEKKPLPPEGGCDLAAENRRLKERVKRLEMENAYLKKLDAMIRADEGRSGRKPRRYPN